MVFGPAVPRACPAVEKLQVTHSGSAKGHKLAVGGPIDRVRYGPDRDIFTAIEYDELSLIKEIYRNGVQMEARGIKENSFRRFMDAITSGDCETATRLLAESPRLAVERAALRASRCPSGDFFDQIKHYIYEGDTALHMAAAAFQTLVVERLISLGADVRAKNRRGAEPLHYAVDGGPGTPAWNPNEQVKIVSMLLGAGANPNAIDKSGVAPLHRAVRNRCAGAVRALIEGGADPQRRNKSGSTPLLLATLTTGKSGSGSPGAKEQQQEILFILKKAREAPT